MIDRLIYSGPLKSHQFGDYERIPQLGVVHKTAATLRPAHEYVTSPVADTQMKFHLEVRGPEEREELVGTIEIPLQSVLFGSNWLHHDLRAVAGEKYWAGRIARWMLETREFTPEEVNEFITRGETELLELTWHVATSSESASLKLLYRLYMRFKTLHLARSRHDVMVESYDWQDRSQRGCLLVRLKNGTHLRFYRKLDEILSSSKRGRRGRPKFAENRPVQEVVRSTLLTHVRVEVIASQNHLRTLGMLHPAKWSEESLRKLIEDTFRLAGLDREYVKDVRKAAESNLGLSEELADTLKKYAGRESLAHLSDKTMTVHRAKILDHGVDIAIPPEKHSYLAPAVGKQVAYGKRFVPPAGLDAYVFSEKAMGVIGPAIEREIEVFRAGHPAEKLRELADLRAGSPRSFLASRLPRTTRDAAQPEVIDPQTGEISQGDGGFHCQ